MSCPQVIKVITPGPPGAPGGAITMTGPAVIGRASGTGAAAVLPLGFGLAIVDGVMVVTATGATDLSYDPSTRLLSSSTGADVTLPLAGTTAGLLSGVAFTGPAGWTASAALSSGSITLSLALPAGSSLVASSDRTSWNAAAALAATAIQPGNPALSDARTPTSHAASHAAGGSDAITPAAIGAATAAQGALAATAVQPAALTAGLAGKVDTTDARLSDAREWSADTVTQAEAEAGTSTTRRAFTAARVFQAIAAWWGASSASTKLAGIQAGATANATDAQLRDRSTHAGTQAASTITGLAAVATSGAYSDLSGRPTLGTAASTDASAYATAAQGVKADTAVQPAALASYAPLYPTRQTLTAASGTYTLDVTSGQEFLTGAAIAGATTINLSGLASLPTNGVWRGVLRFAYTSGTISWFTGNSGYTVKWDGGSAMTPTAGEQEAVIIEVVGGGTVIEVAALRGRS